MQTSAAAIEVEPTASRPDPDYKPQIFENKFVKRSEVEKNPIYNLTSIGVEAVNGKLPKIENLQDLLKNSTDYLQPRIEKARDAPKYWA